MDFQTTVCLDEESTRKQPEIKPETYYYLRDKANSNNQVASKGVIAYEILMLTGVIDENIDGIARIESRVNDQIKSSIGADFLASLEFQGFTTDSENTPQDFVDAVIEREKDNEFGKVNIYLPKKFTDACEVWGFNRTLDSSVAKYREIAYTDRFHRVETKQQILQYVEDDEKPTENIARAIVDGDNTTYDVEEAHQLLMRATQSWADRGDLDFPLLRQKQSEDPLTKQNKDEKLKAFRTAIKNQPTNKESAIAEWEKLFGVTTETARKNITIVERKYDIEWSKIPHTLRENDKKIRLSTIALDYSDIKDYAKRSYLLEEAIKHVYDSGEKVGFQRILKWLGDDEAGWIPIKESNGMNKRRRKKVVIELKKYNNAYEWEEIEPARGRIKRL